MEPLTFAPFQVTTPTFRPPAAPVAPSAPTATPTTTGSARGIVANLLEVGKMAKSAKSLYDTASGLFGGSEVAAEVGSEALPEIASAGTDVGSSVAAEFGTDLGAEAVTAEAAPGVLSTAGPIVAAAVATYYGDKIISNMLGDQANKPVGRIARAVAVGPFPQMFDAAKDVLGGLFGGGNKWKAEGDRLRKLAESGVEIPDELMGAAALTGGRSKEELIRGDLSPDFVGHDSKGNWVNNKFANSRDEKDLSPEDKWGYAAFYELFPDWLKKSEEERRQIAGAASVSEHNGTIDINNKDELLKFAGDVKSNIKQGKMIQTTDRIMKTAGVSYKPLPGSVEAGTDAEGKVFYSSPELINSKNTKQGQTAAASIGATINAMGVFTPEEATRFGQTAMEAGSPQVMAELDKAHSDQDVKKFLQTLGKTDRVGYTGFHMYNTWGSISPAQKSIMMAGAKTQNFTFDDGKDIDDKNATPDVRGAPNLTVGEGLKLAGNQVNVAPLTRKWDQFTALQETMYPTLSGVDVAKTASEMGMLGIGINAAAVPMNKAQVKLLKGTPTPHYGIGAMSIPVGTGVPQGYSKVADLDGSSVIVPQGNERTVNVTTPELSKRNAMKVYNLWGHNEKTKPENGVYGGSAMVSGLDKLDAANPESLGGIMAYSTYRNIGLRDRVSDLTYVAQSAGIAMNRLIKGDSSKQTDSKGLGFRVDGSMNEANYASVARTMRAQYAANGINNKETAYQLANQGFAEGRFNESETVTMQRLVDMIFDDHGYYNAKKLLAGKDKGILIALKRNPDAWKTATEKDKRVI